MPIELQNNVIMYLQNNVNKYCIKTKIPATLTDNKKALKKDINTTSLYFRCRPLAKL